jgi:hypothetical protein
MPYEIVENDAAVMIHGTCFIDELTTPKEIVVDGDLVAKRIAAKGVYVAHGSLVCPTIVVAPSHGVYAEILGLFQLDRPFVAPPHWMFKWLRPVFEPPDPAQWDSTHTIEHVCAMLEHPAVVARPHAPTTALLAKVRRHPTCGRARVLFQVALETLKEHDAFTPLGRQVAETFLAHDQLPKDWRW